MSDSDQNPDEAKMDDIARAYLSIKAKKDNGSGYVANKMLSIIPKPEYADEAMNVQGKDDREWRDRDRERDRDRDRERDDESREERKRRKRKSRSRDRDRSLSRDRDRRKRS